MSNPYDHVATASDAGNLSFSKAKFQKLYPEYFRWIGRKKIIDGQPLQHWLERFAEHLRYGDSRAAVVMSKDPLLVAAYTDELDCIVMLRFPTKRGITKGLSVGQRLLTVNTYASYAQVVSDIHPGPNNTENWENFNPMIADFFSNDQARIEARKQEIAEDEWTRVQQQGEQYLVEKPDHVRNGCPIYSIIPGTPEHLIRRLNVCTSPPNFAVTPAALVRIREVLSGIQLTLDNTAVLMDTTSIHPEIYERKVDLRPFHQLQEDQYFHIQINTCKFAIPKKKAHAYDNVVLGFDQGRGGFIFHNQES